MNDYRIALATPIYRHAHQKYTDARDDLIASDTNIIPVQVRRRPVPDARNALAEASLNLECTHIWFVDADQWGFTDEMLSALLAHDIDIVGPLNFLGGEPYHPVIYQGKEIGEGLIETAPILDYPRNQLFEVDRIGMGCVLIKIGVFAAMDYPWFYQGMTTDKRLVGEDWTFCINARREGFKIFCDSSWCVEHEAEFGMNETLYNMFRMWKKEQQEKVKNDWEGLKDA